jgi:hypothetical protein
LLALDIGGQTGWCLMERHVTPRFGTIDLDGTKTLFGKLGLFNDRLDTMFSTEKFDGMAWEQPLQMPWDKIDQLRLLYGLNALAMRFAWSHDLPWREVTVSEAKATIKGDREVPPGLPKHKARAMGKAIMMAGAKDMGWPVKNHDEADAGAVGLAAYSVIWPRSSETASTATRGTA